MSTNTVKTNPTETGAVENNVAEATERRVVRVPKLGTVGDKDLASQKGKLIVLPMFWHQLLDCPVAGRWASKKGWAKTDIYCAIAANSKGVSLAAYSRHVLRSLSYCYSDLLNTDCSLPVDKFVEGVFHIPIGELIGWDFEKVPTPDGGYVCLELQDIKGGRPVFAYKACYRDLETFIPFDGKRPLWGAALPPELVEGQSVAKNRGWLFDILQGYEGGAFNRDGIPNNFKLGADVMLIKKCMALAERMVSKWRALGGYKRKTGVYAQLAFTRNKAVGGGLMIKYAADTAAIYDFIAGGVFK